MSFLVTASKLIRPIVRIGANPKVTGIENFPQNTDTPIILCANHISNWDPLIVATTFPYDW